MCEQIAIPLRVLRPSRGRCNDDHVVVVGDIYQRRDEGLAGLATEVFEQKCRHRLSESSTESQVSADSPAGTAIDPCVNFAVDARNLRDYRRIQQAGRLFFVAMRFIPPGMHVLQWDEALMGLEDAAESASASFRSGSRCQNRIVDRRGRDGDDCFLGSTCEIQQVATFRAPRCQRVIDGLGDPLGVGCKLLHTP